MAKGKRDPNQFTVVVQHPEAGPTLEEINNNLHDWYQELLITGKYKKCGEVSPNVIPSQVDPDRQE